jgi:hypothetical protein
MCKLELAGAIELVLNFIYAVATLSKFSVVFKHGQGYRTPFNLQLEGCGRSSKSFATPSFPYKENTHGKP